MENIKVCYKCASKDKCIVCTRDLVECPRCGEQFSGSDFHEIDTDLEFKHDSDQDCDY